MKFPKFILWIHITFILLYHSIKYKCITLFLKKSLLNIYLYLLNVPHYYTYLYYSSKYVARFFAYYFHHLMKDNVNKLPYPTLSHYFTLIRIINGRIFLTKLNNDINKSCKKGADQKYFYIHVLNG